MYTFTKQVVAVIGATGQVGTPLTKHLLTLGHEVKCFSRRESDEKLKDFRSRGAEIILMPAAVQSDDTLNNGDVEKMAKHLEGVDILICAVPGSKEIITISEPIWLKAAVKAGVKRFVPTEFGGHSRNIDVGDCVLFDHKKELHEQIFASGIGWTFFYTGGIFDYHLPNLRFFDKITSFGDIDLPIFTHEIEDIAEIAAMALTDPRTLNKCVQMDYNFLSQKEMLEKLKENFPDYPFEYEHFSTEFITEAKNTAADEIPAKKGNETDPERWGINYLIYVAGKMAAFTDETVRTTELYPKYECAAKPEKALADKTFVFEK
jgi:uncharacterized protein YbjT (DUF2867 family)